MTLDLVHTSPVVLYSSLVLPVNPSPLTSLAAVLRPSQALLSSAQQSVENENTILFDFLDAAETAPVVVWGVDDEVGGTITILGELTHPDIDYTPHYGIEKNIGIGTTGIQISGTTSALEAFSAQTPEDTILFSFGSAAIEKFGGDPPENTQLFSFSGEIETPLRTFAEQPTGTINVSGEVVEKQEFNYDGRGPINVGVPFSYTDTYDLGLSGSFAETFIAQFGSAIAATENKVIIGAPGRAVSGQYNKGAAFIYNHDGTGITTVTGVNLPATSE